MLEGLEDRALLSGTPTTYTVTDVSDSATDAGSLRHAIAQANLDPNPAGSLIRFDPAAFSSPQTITLSSTLELSGTAGPEVIEGPGAAVVTISGNGSVRVFQVDKDVAATIGGLTVSGGGATRGAGIDNAGTLWVRDSTLSGNSALGDSIPVNGVGGDGDGGGIYNTGTLTVTATNFSNDRAGGASGSNGGGSYGGGSGHGGGIYNAGSLTVAASTFAQDSASGGGGIYPGSGYGGGVYNAGTLTITATAFSSDEAGGAASYGGGIYNAGSLTVAASTFADDSASGGSGIGFGGYSGGSGHGGGIYNTGTLTVTASTFADDSASGGFGSYVGGSGTGGGIYNTGDLTVTECTFSRDSASGSVGRSGGGPGAGGGIYNTGTLAITTSTFASNLAVLAGGDGDGGGIYNAGLLTVTASTFGSNSAVGLVGGKGGGIYNAGSLTVTASTFGSNSASGYSGDISFGGSGGGIYNAGRLAATASTFGGNAARSGGGIVLGTPATGSTSEAVAIDNLFQNAKGGNISIETGGAFRSLGHNLFSDAPAVALDPTDLINTDPLLGPLADNGGPTMTMALLPGSPAIDAAVPVPGMTTDQRGIPRPQGTAPDIGAFESRGFTIAIVSGNNQRATSGSAFPAPLAVRVTSPFGEPVAGGRVIFAVPATGAAAVLSSNPATIAAEGQAAVTATANGIGGAYAVTARAGGAMDVAFTLDNFGPPAVTGVSSATHSPRGITRIVVGFSEDLVPRSATNRRLFVVATGVQRRHKVVFGKRVKIGGVSYDGAAHQVTISLARPIKGTVRLTVRAGIQATNGLSSRDGFTAVVA